MTAFTATNGVKLDEFGAFLDIGGVGTMKDVHAARIEFYQHLRDEALGRWRWPENRDLVVYENQLGVAFVFDEDACDYRAFTRTEAAAIEGLDYRQAARAYFDAHPEPKPWHDAKPGAVWLFKTVETDRHALAWRAFSGWDVIDPRGEGLKDVADPIAGLIDAGWTGFETAAGEQLHAGNPTGVTR